MALPGLKYASTGWRAALKVGSRLRRKRSEAPGGENERTGSQRGEESEIGPAGQAGLNVGAPTSAPLVTLPPDAQQEPPVASLAALLEAIADYLDEADLARVREAYRFADQVHLGQFRDSGIPYITHPIAVAEVCAAWKLDAPALMAALLHDVMEDHGISKQELAERFGNEVAELVDGLSKLDRLEFASKMQQQAESFRKMLLATARDVRVILIKLADRAHNMRTLGGVAPEKRRRVAHETLDIYAPIAHRLGLNALYREFQDLCFAAMHPNRYAVLYKAVLAARGNRHEVIGKIAQAVRAALPAAGIEAEVSGREKNLYGVYRKMRTRQKSFSEVLDIYGFRIIVHTLPECYLALGALHQLYRPVPGTFKDYIAIPKLNGYQSLHTTLLGPYGTPVEFQFRTRDMHYVAEEGVASHWLYKAADVSLSDLQKRTHQWLQSLLDIQSQTGDSGEFLEHVKVDLFPDAVYVFTPRGKIISLPRGATPVDFAYAIHTDVGHQAVAAKVNHEFAPLRTELRSGDLIEIITSPASRPSAQWLNYVRTGRARSEIRHYLRTDKYEESVAFGARLLAQALDALKLSLPAPDDPAWEKLARASGAQSRAEILADIGLGKRLAAVVARRFAPEHSLIATTAAAEDEISAARAAPILIQGNEGQAVQLAPCCGPLPGDAIIAGMRLGHGLVVHTADCLTAQRARAREPERWVPVAWHAEPARHFATRLDITTRNERGVFGRIAAEITAADSNIVHVSMQDDAVATVILHLTLHVDSRTHLAQVIRAIRHVPQVQRIARGRG